MNGLLKCSGTSDTKNIGDYIQTVAQEQFWDKVDCYVEREEMNTIRSDEKINVIMNGWYMWQPQNFPPAECINPLFISIHINPKAENDFFSERTIAYLKEYEPIGARDKGTQKLLEQHGINSYYSSCLTLTLGAKYKTQEKNNKIIFVDPYVFRKESPKLIVKSLIKAFFHFLKHPCKSHRLANKISYNPTRISNYCKWLDRHLYMASFYEVYSKVFDDELLFNADYISHTVNNVGVTDDEKMQQARNLVKLYAGAKLVVTSRIHAALPCLGVETPVIFIPSSGLDATRENAGRFDGIEDMFNVIRWCNGKLILECEEIRKNLKQGKLSNNIEIVNPNKYVVYRDRLNEIVRSWCKNPDEKLPPPVSKSRKIAIISFVTNSSHLNYGATLHGYAFQQYLHQKGVDSIVIDYYPKAVDGDNLKYPILNQERGRSFAKQIAIKTNWLIGFWPNINRYKKFHKFIKNNIITTDTQYDYQSLRTAEKIDNLDIDSFVCESDVIWKVTGENSIDDNFFLAFPAAHNARKVAYAPTLSTKQLSDGLLLKFKQLTSSFDAISARENAGANYLEKILGRGVSTVLDPTLLLDATDYDHLCIKPKEDKYLLIYNVTTNDVAMVKESVRYAKAKGLKIVEISNYAINKVLVPHKVKVGAGIEEWIGYIKYADTIITNSFHGFCFSVIYKKDVFLFQRDNSDYKMQNIAEIMGLSNRLIPCDRKSIPDDVKPIDWAAVDARLSSLRKISHMFIDDNIIKYKS